MPDREFSSTNYRFGFNGQEVDKDLAGGAGVVFKYRIHDARIGRFLSVDPLAPEYPWNSTYAFAENRVIDGLDLEGLEWVHYAYLERDKRGKAVLTIKSVGESSGNIQYSVPWNFETFWGGNISHEFPITDNAIIVHYGFYRFYFHSFDEINNFDWESIDPHRPTTMPYYGTLEYIEKYLEGFYGITDAVGGPRSGGKKGKIKPQGWFNNRPPRDPGEGWLKYLRRVNAENFKRTLKVLLIN